MALLPEGGGGTRGSRPLVHDSVGGLVGNAEEDCNVHRVGVVEGEEGEGLLYRGGRVLGIRARRIRRGRPSCAKCANSRDELFADLLLLLQGLHLIPFVIQGGSSSSVCECLHGKEDACGLLVASLVLCDWGGSSHWVGVATQLKVDRQSID